jgi:uncharacterized protein YhfF
MEIFMGNEYPVWIRYLESIGEDPRSTKKAYKFADQFGSDPESQGHLYDLVIEGKKRATTGSLWACEHDQEPVLEPGDLSILTNHDGSKACVLRTLKVSIKEFREVSEDEAGKEGEGDGSYAYWKKAHVEFLTSECERIGKAFSETMPVVFEEFEIAYK